MAKKPNKQEALSVSRLINEVLVSQLGIPFRTIVNDSTFSSYTGSKRPDILISNFEYDGTNDEQYIENLIAYVEAKDTNCIVNDKNWEDAINQGVEKATKLKIPFFGVTNCKTTYFYNTQTKERLSLNGNLIYEFQTLDIFRIIKKCLVENPKATDIKIGFNSLSAVSEAVFNKKLWELKEIYRAIDFENNTQKIDFTVGLIALEYYEEKSELENTKDESLQYWSDIRKLIQNPSSYEKANMVRTILLTYIDRLIRDDSEFKDFAPLLISVKQFIEGKIPNLEAKFLQDIYFVIDSMRPLHGTGFDLFGAVYENFANSKEKKDFGEYFTRRHYSRVFAELLLQDEDEFSENDNFSILDPACGTGGMLTESFKVLKNNYERTNTFSETAKEFLSKRCFYGVDIRSENISRTRLNMFLVGDGHTNMQADNSLNPKTSLGKEIFKKQFKYIITNPPYGTGKELADTDSLNSYRYEVAFICRIIDSLQLKGKACVIIPDGILENPSMKAIRKEILMTCEVYAIVSLPKFAFAPYTKEKTYALFLRKRFDRMYSDIEKKHKPTGKFQDKPVWMYIIDNDGFANSDKRFPTRLRDKNQQWLHDEVSGYSDAFGNERKSILEQRWLSFDDKVTQTEWIGETGTSIKQRKGGFIPFAEIENTDYLTLLPEYYLRPYEPSFITEKELEKEIAEINKSLRELLNEIS